MTKIGFEKVDPSFQYGYSGQSEKSVDFKMLHEPSQEQPQQKVGGIQFFRTSFCCCGVDLKTGAQILCYLRIVFYGLAMFLIPAFLVQVLLAAIYLYGIHENKPSWMLLNTVIEIISFFFCIGTVVLTTIYLIAFPLIKDKLFKERSGEVTFTFVVIFWIFWALTSVLQWHFASVFYSLYRKMKEALASKMLQPPPQEQPQKNVGGITFLGTSFCCCGIDLKTGAQILCYLRIMIYVLIMLKCDEALVFVVLLPVTYSYGIVLYVLIMLKCEAALVFLVLLPITYLYGIHKNKPTWMLLNTIIEIISFFICFGWVVLTTISMVFPHFHISTDKFVIIRGDWDIFGIIFWIFWALTSVLQWHFASVFYSLYRKMKEVPAPIIRYEVIVGV